MTELATILEATILPPTVVTLPGSGSSVEIATFLRQETRSTESISRSPRCWAPNKPALEFDDRPTWAEFVIVALLERAGWDARWIKNWARGREFCVAPGQAKDLPRGPGRTFANIHNRAEALRGAGSWDVFAWKRDDYLLIESKQHRSSDHLRENQLSFLEAALEEGISAESFAVVEYAVESRTTRARAGSPRHAALAEPIPEELQALLDSAAGVRSSIERTELREPIAGFGLVAIRPIQVWADAGRPPEFAIMVLERIGRDHGPEAAAALRNLARKHPKAAAAAAAAAARLRRGPASSR